MLGHNPAIFQWVWFYFGSYLLSEDFSVSGFFQTGRGLFGLKKYPNLKIWLYLLHALIYFVYQMICFLWHINYFFCSRCTYIYLYIFYFSLSAFSLWGALCEEVRAPELGCTFWKYVNVAITRNLYSPKIWMDSCLYNSKCVLYCKHIKHCSLTCESTESNVNKSSFYEASSLHNRALQKTFVCAPPLWSRGGCFTTFVQGAGSAMSAGIVL